MTKLQKILLGISSFLPLIFVICYLIAIVGPMRSFMIAAVQHPNDPGAIMTFLPDVFSSIFLLMIPTMIITIALLIIFIIHASKNPSISDGERVVWIIVFFLAGTFAFPVYFFVRIYGSGNAQAGRDVLITR